MKALGYMKAVAPTDLAVIVQGETGTGKTYVAHAIHELGRRSGMALHSRAACLSWWCCAAIACRWRCAGCAGVSRGRRAGPGTGPGACRQP